MSGWSAECIGPQLECDTKYSPPIVLFVADADSAQCNLLLMKFLRVVWNIDSFQRELSRYAYDAIRLQYHDIRYNAMYRAITN